MKAAAALFKGGLLYLGVALCCYQAESFARSREGWEYADAVNRCLNAYDSVRCMQACHEALEQQSLSMSVDDSDKIASRLAECSQRYDEEPREGRFCNLAGDSVQNIFNAEHPGASSRLLGLARQQFRQGKLDEALSLLRNASRFHDSEMRTALSEADLHTMLSLFSEARELAVSMMLKDTKSYEAARLALSITLLQKGRLLDVAATFNRALRNAPIDTELRPKIAKWQALRQQHDKLLFGGSPTFSPAEYRRQLEDLSSRAETLEHQISGKLSKRWKDQSPALESAVGEVARQLPQGGTLVEIVQARLESPTSAGAQSRRSDPHYVAMLLTPGEEINVVDLGLASGIDTQVQLFLESLQSPSSNPTNSAQALYRQALLPLQPYLKETSEIFLSLDGTLNLVPFDALHDGTDYLLGRYRFHYLSSGRDLLRARSQRALQPPLILADPDFGQSATATVEPRAGVPSLYERLTALRRLPGTQREAKLLGVLLGIGPKIDKQATEEAMWSVHSPSILHIATHGMFLQASDMPGYATTNQVLLSPPNERSKNVAAGGAEQLAGEADAMHRSALALAGVMQGHLAGNPAKDGLLTAEEARGLDLEGTQLVTLSACESGQGALSTGQGVYGLRRAFLAAGAETVVTSLWRVHDEATGELMALYYANLLNKQKPGDRLGGMIQAMQELRHRKGRSHPYYWAPFLVIGQDGPLRP